MKTQWVVLVALIFAAMGCSSTGSEKQARPDDEGPYSNRWATNATQEDLPPIGLLIEPGPAAQLGYRIGWASPIELISGQSINSVTVLDDMIIVVEKPENVITAIDAETGDTKWKTALGSKLETVYPPRRDGEEIFFNTATRFFTLRDRDGQVQSVAPMETSVSSPGSYTAMARLMIFSGSNGTIFAHSVNSNLTRWRYQLSGQVSSPPVIAGQDVFVIDTSGTYALLETVTGRPLWRNRTIGNVSTTPVIQGSDIIVASEDGKLYAFNLTTGKDTWKYLGAEQPLVASPVALGRLIIQPLKPDGGLVAVNAINGEEIWRNDVNATPVTTRQNDMLLFNPKSLVTVDLNDGETLIKAKTLDLMDVKPVGEEGAVLLVSPNGRLLKLSPI